MLKRGLSKMSEPKSCCDQPIKFVIVYENAQIIAVCHEHSQKFEYQRGIKAMFDYETKREITPQEAFFVPRSTNES